VKVVEARVNGLIFEQKTQQNVVILKEAGGERILPIWIGPGEAHAIRRMLSGEPFPRPLTHDLLVLLVEGLKARVARVVISDLRESTFFASVMVQRDGEVLSIDARPSDSIAVALRAKAPIFVNVELLQEPPRRLEVEGGARRHPRIRRRSPPRRRRPSSCAVSSSSSTPRTSASSSCSRQ
jgi:bifunctional DNase/RNase